MHTALYTIIICTSFTIFHLSLLMKCIHVHTRKERNGYVNRSIFRSPILISMQVPHLLHTIHNVTQCLQCNNRNTIRVTVNTSSRSIAICNRYSETECFMKYTGTSTRASCHVYCIKHEDFLYTPLILSSVLSTGLSGLPVVTTVLSCEN